MIIGLTGGIGVGKSFIANCFKEFGAALFDADSVVHQLYKVNKNIISYAEEKFPGVVANDEIDRKVLSKYFLAYDENWKQFQSLVHSAVRNELEIFIAQEKENDRKFLVLDIPLLLETRFRLYCDFIVFIHADSAVQAQRLSERNMDKEKLDLMSSIQLPIEEKRQMSDFIIDTSANVFSQVKDIINSLDLST
ncbi:dephospho-CoA kinase [Wolbachia endosymbiont of Diaphorina citri]|jgi:dephospho-CoA kinase|uniref:dephospho-CoA kinase n=1 Tax=Wolbachia endosymbiont of Diaphorina citri TaxID=116598 RepID=UPI00030E9DB3|nr:dephospho-CoA kinase [Wolbachia endosymbiont of Diaphorina citri]QJT94740.1 dephospho-CoA kinase [Wolbachia endosymbiont of Diaphorina citri]QJT95979.1 dephospho-CoA kinase [Wolbachia endosymbiont of Diaphorina citri]QJT97340.1 dephospho-CoA kinase [Wolbachia endosymbiont of Diaphorina citri]QLK11636.1 dephospho-CoA kinase [Wolbachia endosymbiont of Diaphorina citri]QXY86830.1 dephospho-CoA kinase [Wolbachia endosymbiont of Diaphorina citri]